MAHYIAKRLLYLIPMLFCVVLMVFLIMSLTPGDPATNVLPLTTPQEVKDAYNESVGFTGSLWDRFWNYLGGLFSGNVLSYSTGENIFEELQIRFPLTLSFGTVAFCISAESPMATVKGLWIIMRAVGAMSTVVPAMATTEAADAAMPSTFTVTLPL